MEACISRPGLKSSDSTLVKGQGPAMQESLTLRNSFPSPASMSRAPSDAFHLPSGEQRDCPLHGIFPELTTSKTLTALPTLTAADVLVEYLTLTLETPICGCF